MKEKCFILGYEEGKILEDLISYADKILTDYNALYKHIMDINNLTSFLNTLHREAVNYKCISYDKIPVILASIEFLTSIDKHGNLRSTTVGLTKNERAEKVMNGIYTISKELKKKTVELLP